VLAGLVPPVSVELEVFAVLSEPEELDELPQAVRSPRIMTAVKISASIFFMFIPPYKYFDNYGKTGVSASAEITSFLLPARRLFLPTCTEMLEKGNLVGLFAENAG
jgi:hypothetical protein